MNTPFLRTITLCCLLLAATQTLRAQARLWSFGSAGAGNIFSTNPDGSSLQKKYTFNGDVYNAGQPSGGNRDVSWQEFTHMTELDGKLYGTRLNGGPNPGSNRFTGDNAGVLFQFDPVTGKDSTMYVFNLPTGANPLGSLIVRNGVLWGMTSGGGNTNLNSNLGYGVIFSFNPSTSEYTVVYKFSGNPDGGTPRGSLCLSTTDGLLYGMTSSGGPTGGSNTGTLFSIDPDGGASSFQVRENTGGWASLTEFNGLLYGTSSPYRLGGTLFSYDPSTSIYTPLYTLPKQSVSTLLAYNGLLYGTLVDGGINNAGELFSFDPVTKQYTVLHDMASLLNNGGSDNIDGANPYGDLAVLNNKLWGTAADGGLATNTQGSGGLFSYDLSSRQYKIEYFFGQTDRTTGSSKEGNDSYGSVIPYNGKLYGIMPYGGSNGGGTIFSWDPSAASIQTLLNFNLQAINGSGPSQSMYAYKGLLYGTTAAGSTFNDGTLFSFNPQTNALTTLAAFDPAFTGFAGFNASAVPPVAAANGKLYGSMPQGGRAATNGVGNASGVIYEFDPATNTIAAPYTFSDDFSAAGGGASPIGAMAAVGNVLYGQAGFGANENADGCIFSYDVSTHTYTPEFIFDEGALGAYPSSGLVSSNGLLFGSNSYGGAYSAGVIFSFDPKTKVVTDLYDLGSATGFGYTPTMAVYNNVVYAVSNSGGSKGNGGIFSIDPVTKQFTDIYDFTERVYLSSLVGYQGKLIGFSSFGTSGNGFTFSFDLATKNYSKTEPFTAADPFRGAGILLLKSTPAITFANINTAYGQTDITLTVTSTNTNTANLITYTIADPSIATIVSGKLHILKAGTTIITAGQLEDEDNYADTVQRTLTVAKAALTVSADPLTIEYGTAIPTTFTAAYTGFIGSDDASVLTVSPVFTTTATAASVPGDYPINVDTTSMSAVNYHFVIQAGHLTINPATTTIQFGTIPTTITYGDAPFDPGATATSGASPAYTSSNPAVATITGDNKVQLLGAGTATITVTFPATATANGGTKDLAITIAKKIVTLTVDNAYMLAGTALPNFTATINGLVNGDPASVLTPAPQFATTASSGSPEGTYDITVINIASLTAANYIVDANYQKGSLSIGNVVFSGSDTRTYGIAPYDPGATSNNGTTPVYTSGNTAVAIITADNKVQIKGAGTTTITANFAAAGGSPAVSIPQTLTVQPAPLSIKIDDASRPFGQPNPVFNITYQGFVYNDAAGVLLTPAQAGTTATIVSAPGTYPVTPFNATAANYTITNLPGTLTVTKAPQTITFDPQADQSTGNADFTLTATANSGLPVSYSSSNPNVVTISGSTVHINGAGTVTITASQPGNANYDAAPGAQQTLTVNGLTTTITLPSIPSMTYGDPDFTVTATSNNSTIPIVYVSSNTNVAIVDAVGVIHITGAGTTTITATQTGNKDYSPGSSLAQTLNVNKAPLVVTVFNQTLYQGQTPSPFVIGYSGFVNGDDTTSIPTKATASTPANTNSPIGTYPIAVGGAAAPNYTFSYVSGMITVLPAQPQTISFNALPLERYGNADFDPGASTTSGQPVTYATSDPTVAAIVNGQVHLVGAGRVTISATQPGGNGFGPAASVAQTISVGKGQLTIRPDDATIGAGQALPALTITYTGFVNGDDASSLTKLPVVTSAAVGHDLNFGQYAITASGAESPNYDITYLSGSLTVTSGSDQLNAFSSGPGQVTVSIFTGAVQKATIQFYSLSGQLVTEQQVQLFKNVNTFTLNTGNIASGIYIVKVWGEVSRLSQKIKIK